MNPTLLRTRVHYLLLRSTVRANRRADAALLLADAIAATRIAHAVPRAQFYARDDRYERLLTRVSGPSSSGKSPPLIKIDSCARRSYTAAISVHVDGNRRAARLEGRRFPRG